MNFKGLIFDIDGTAVPLHTLNALPTTKLKGAIQKIKNSYFIATATARTFSMASGVIKELGLTDPCIVLGGAQIIDPQTKTVLWEKFMSEATVEQIVAACQPYPHDLLFGDEEIGQQAKNKKITGVEHIIYIMGIENHRENTMIALLEKIPNIVIHKAPSWTSNLTDLHITSSGATKKDAVEMLLSMSHLKKEEVVGIGDGDNDTYLFEAVGYKVAMGNAIEELKNRADFIAPAVEDDGLAQAVEKLFV